MILYCYKNKIQITKQSKRNLVFLASIGHGTMRSESKRYIHEKKVSTHNREKPIYRDGREMSKHMASSSDWLNKKKNTQNA